VICNPLGKSGGALIQQFMIIGFGSLAASTPYLGAILLGIVLLWIQAAASLNGQFVQLQKESEYCGLSLNCPCLGVLVVLARFYQLSTLGRSRIEVV
jgi:ATP/ADP translocase